VGSSCSSIPECSVEPPPTPTPTECQLPPLNTDFSDLLYFFVDAPNNVAIGVSSTGEDSL